jgi:hypothetical protein
MKLFKVSGVGSGIIITYKQLEFETNPKILSALRSSINEQESDGISRQ